MNASSRPSGGRNAKATKALKKNSNNGMIITVVALLVIAVLAIGGIIWWAKKDSASTGIIEATGTADPKVTITDQGVIAVGDEKAPTVQLWEDFLCPACGSFEKQYGKEIATAVEGGKLRAEYHLMNFLDRSSKSGKYSTRALAAMQCVAAKEPVHVVLDVKSAFFTTQPQEGGGDKTAQELAETATSAGATSSIDCITNVAKNGGMDKAKTTAENSLDSVKKVNPQVSTPTVAYDGKQVQFSDPNWLKNILANKG